MTTSNYAKYRRPLTKYENSNEKKPKPRYPEGVTHLSEDGQEWHKLAAPPAFIRYGRTDDMKYFLRNRDDGRWASVTPQHVEHFGRTEG